MHPSFLVAFLGSAAPALLALAPVHGGVYQPPPSGTPSLGGTLPGTPVPTNAVPVVPTTTPGSTGEPATDFSLWSWWWEFQKEPFLDLKAHVHDAGASTGSDGFFLGQGYRQPARGGTSRPTVPEVHGRIVPALLRTLAGEDRPDVLTGALMALAKIGEDQGGANQRELELVLQRYLPHQNQEVSETATIALGVLGVPSAAALLGDLLLDTDAGRAAVGKSEVPWRTRSFAAYGLGVLAAGLDNADVRRFAVHRLARALETDRSAVPDVQVACIIAMGRVPLPPAGHLPSAEEEPSASVSREAQVQALLAVLRERTRDRLVRAHVPVSLGILLEAEPGLEGTALEQEVVLDLIGRVDIGSREPRELQQSCVIALGMLGDQDSSELDTRIRRTLFLLARTGSDAAARHFALISIAKVAARPGSGDSPGVGEARDFLLATLARGSTEAERWAGLAGALLERSLAERGDTLHEPLIQAVRARLAESASPSDVGAFAVAAGLLRDQEASVLLLERLRSVSEEQARGHVAVALGLVDSRDAIEPIRRIVQDSTYRPVLLREAATALGLLRDSQAVSLLLDQLERASSQAAQASIAQAMGRIGDRRAIEPLLELLEKPGTTTGARAFAAVALGIVADRRPLPWNSILSVGVNYAAATPTLYDGQGLGVLNIL